MLNYVRLSLYQNGVFPLFRILTDFFTHHAQN